jgi:transposase InsO family protein
MVIKESKIKLPINKRCMVLNVSRSGYYRWLKTPSDKVDTLESLIIKIYHKHKGTYGRQRITQALRNSGITVNHKKVYRIMKKHGLEAVIRKKYCYRNYTKDYVAENVLNREFQADKPLSKLVCDVTELKRINDKRYYLFSVLDLYNNAIVASNVSIHNNVPLVLDCLNNSKISGVILHSDQGAQFTSKQYRELSIQKRLTVSMSRVGNCYDNAAKESFFGHFKEEFYIYHNPKTQEELYKNINEFIQYYNHERIQMRLKMSPVEYLRTHHLSIAS